MRHDVRQQSGEFILEKHSSDNYIKYSVDGPSERERRTRLIERIEKRRREQAEYLAKLTMQQGEMKKNELPTVSKSTRVTLTMRLSIMECCIAVRFLVCKCLRRRIADE